MRFLISKGVKSVLRFPCVLCSTWVVFPPSFKPLPGKALIVVLQALFSETLPENSADRIEAKIGLDDLLFYVGMVEETISQRRGLQCKRTR